LQLLAGGDRRGLVQATQAFLHPGPQDEREPLERQSNRLDIGQGELARQPHPAPCGP
jgi:hypothetical protein